MALRIGIVGLGFMGKMHFDTYGRMKHAKVTAICDVDPKKRAGDWSGIRGNIGGGGRRVNLSGVRTYSSLRDMLADPGVDVVDVTLPTYLHARAAIAAFRAGKHVICEKPLAINAREAAAVVTAARLARRRLFVAQCIRFWPQYAVARNLVRSGKWGRVLTAAFRRFSSSPLWSWQGWLQDPRRSGLAALDLHIHDADFVLHTFGTPRSVTAHGGGLKAGRLDHILASYDYGKGKLVTAEGAWEFAAGFPFSMTFAIVMQKATLAMGPDLKLLLHRVRGGTVEVKAPAGDGYGHELAHFVECIRKNKASPVVTPESALQSVKLVEAEVRSVRSGKTVRVRL
ncbi:MAG: Gfo/Idh/MocA family oxidoreductase [Candidatus Coatesbacteria bacterium]